MPDDAKSPAVVAAQDIESTYYVTDMTKTSYCELLRQAWKLSRQHPVAILGFAVIFVHKLFGRPFRHGPLFKLQKNPFHQIEMSQIPPDVYRQMESQIQPLCDAGFQPICALENINPGTRSYCLALEHRDRLQVANVVYVETLGESSQLERLNVNISSKRTGGTTVMTTNRRHGFDLPPKIRANYVQGSVADVISQHRRTITELTDVDVIRPEDLLPKTNEPWSEFTQLQIDRGYYTPATPEEIAHSRHLK